MVGRFPAGTPLEADGVTPDGQWVRVLHLDGAAWALRAALDAEADLSNLPVITRDSRTPMQSFRFTTGTDRSGCLSVPPPVLVVQGPEDFPVDITANGVDIRIQSTIFLRTLPGNVMQIIAGSGGAVLYPNTANKVFLSPAVSVLIPLGDDGFAADLYSQWRMLVGDEIDPYAALENVPSNIWNYPYVHPTLIVPSGIGVLPTPTVFPPGRPPVRPRPPFPRPPIVPRGRGVALTRVPWQPITIGDPTCPPWTFYHSNRDGGWDIFRLGSALDNNVSLGRGSSNIQPSASPDGEWVAFTSNRDQPGNWEVWISSADGSVQQRVTFNSADDVNPVWGPGALIAFESNRNDSWDLYLFDVSTGGEPVRLTDHPANDINPFWFPDGEHIAFQSDRDGNWEIYQLNINTGDLTRLTEEDTDDQNPVISNDGTMLAWLQKNAFGVYDLWLMDLETGETRQLTDTGTDVAGHQFAPDDTFLAYHTSLDGEFDVFVVDIESGQIKNVTNSPNTEDRAAAFWCESTAIVFHSDRVESAEYPGQRELFQVNPLPIDGPATGATRLTSDPTSDNIYPLGSLREEINSREGRVPPRP